MVGTRGSEDEVAIAQRRIRELEQQLAARDRELAELEVKRRCIAGTLIKVQRRNTKLEAAQAQRRAEMLSANPKFILRNYQAHETICALEDEDDPSKLHRLLRVLERPFDEQPEAEAEGFAEPAPLQVAQERGVTILS